MLVGRDVYTYLTFGIIGIYTVRMKKSNNYFLIKGNNSENKIHIIWPQQIKQHNNSVLEKSITEVDFSRHQNYIGWCKTSVNGGVGKFEDFTLKDIQNNICENCKKKAINSNNINLDNKYFNLISK